jgi:hypothetical protein
VTINAALAALSAGLDRDEQLARAAASRNAAGDPSEWWTSGPVCDAAEIVAGGVRRDNGHGGTGVFDSVTVARSMAIEDALHIVNVDPHRVLRQVEAHRRILARHHPVETPGLFVVGGPRPGSLMCAGCGSKGNGVGSTPWPCPDVQDLASIYDPEDTGDNS